MNLESVFQISLYSLTALGGAMLAYGEETPFPSGLTVLMSGLALLFNERRRQWRLRVRLPERPIRGFLQRQFAGDRRCRNGGYLPGPDEPAVPPAQPFLCFPRDIADGFGKAFLPHQQLAADPCREAVSPGSLDQYPARRTVARLGNPTLAPLATAGGFGWQQSKIGHELTGTVETRDIAEFGDQHCRGHQS